jgi:rhodanese-related sulfurtransferase
MLNLFGNLLPLNMTEALIAAAVPVAEITPEDLSAIVSGSGMKALSLFDIREPEEFEVSHIATAQLVDPAIEREAFIRQFASDKKQTVGVCYCSVGLRSSELIKRMGTLPSDSGITSLLNLRGGIFRWYNEGMPVFNNEGETNMMHHYNAFWSLMLKLR